MTYTLTLKQISPLTHDTHHLVFDRPEGFGFTPGQAVDLSIEKDGWRDEARPFTFISLPDEKTLEFAIKSYPDHDGVTEQIAKLEAGDSVTISDPWGAFEDHGAGLFVAGGAGVTPFISILRHQLQRKGSLEGSTLVFSNKTEADIILRDNLARLPGLKTVFVVTDQESSPLSHAPVDADFLLEQCPAGDAPVYICGPDGMVTGLSEELAKAGVSESRIITEDFG